MSKKPAKKPTKQPAKRAPRRELTDAEVERCSELVLGLWSEGLDLDPIAGEIRARLGLRWFKASHAAAYLQCEFRRLHEEFIRYHHYWTLTHDRAVCKAALQSSIDLRRLLRRPQIGCL